MDNNSEETVTMNEAERSEFSSYIANRFEGCEEDPSQDTSFLIPWEGIVFYAGIAGAAEAINSKVIPKRPVIFRSPDLVSISIEDSFAGQIPVISVKDPLDFEDLVTNTVYKGIRPDNLEKTGASFVFGKTTRFIIVSAKPYSNVPASDLGLEDAEWAEKSLKLRFGHECTHYYTKQTFGISNNILHDEIMADFTGLYEAFGFYRAEWFLRFMGLVGESGGRLIFYTKDLSEKVRNSVSSLLTKAAYGLEEWSRTEEFCSLSVAGRINRMCRLGLEGMCSMTGQSEKNI